MRSFHSNEDNSIVPTSQVLGWILAITIASIAIASATAKWIGLPTMQRKWDEFLRLPRWLLFWSGVFEAISAIAFLIPGTVRWGAGGLTAYLLAAWIIHARISAWRTCLYLTVMVPLVWLSVHWR
ncbi:DoxX family protein [Neorhodopirellula pilleata]|uniref:DoxX family protein n=1 Tax=Neorhodopirellula pilleata TaxID=2714738 RepID=UPI0018CCC995|nr:DoxX family protein [Neorhodopirellula pilleata]